MAGLQKPSPELYNSWISSRIRSSAVRVLTSGPHPTSQRCHVKIFDFAMAVPAKPGPASLKACRLARPPSPKGKAFCCLTTRGLSERCASFPATPASPRWRASNLRFEPCHPAGGGITLPLAKLPCEWGSTPEGDRAPRSCCALIVAASVIHQEPGSLPSRLLTQARHLPIHMGRLGRTMGTNQQLAVCRLDSHLSLPPWGRWILPELLAIPAEDG